AQHLQGEFAALLVEVVVAEAAVVEQGGERAVAGDESASRAGPAGGGTARGDHERAGPAAVVVDEPAGDLVAEEAAEAVAEHGERDVGGDEVEELGAHGVDDGGHVARFGFGPAVLAAGQLHADHADVRAERVLPGAVLAAS